MKRYRLKLMFEWGGGCLWADNVSTFDRFDVGPIEAKLPLSEETKTRLSDLSELHDTALNWSDPAGPSPWNADQFEAFDKQAIKALRLVEIELGGEFEITYVPLGQAE